MSHLIEIELPGLTGPAAIELDRRANLLGSPFEFVTSRAGRRGGRLRRASVEMTDLREDPSLASETLDHPDAWPQDPTVRRWLAGAVRALAEMAPAERFTFHAGWTEQCPKTVRELDLPAFLALVEAGRLRVDVRYDVRTSG